jgi:hypothetical protein
LATLGLIALFRVPVAANSVDDIRAHLDQLRGIVVTSDAEKLKALNHRMDDAWRYIEQHEREALPVVREELGKELQAATPDPFFLLDTAFLLAQRDPQHSTALCLSALEHIDPAAPLTRANAEELFHLVMRLGRTGQGPERYLAQVDRIYLPGRTGLTFFAAPHVVQLEADDLLVMAYGVAGAPAAAHLCHGAAAGGPHQVRIARLLPTVCSEDDTPALAALLATARDPDVIEAVITALMDVGGPSGRAAVLAYAPPPADTRTRDYLQQIRPAVAAVDLNTFDRQLLALDPPKKMNDRDVQRALDTMERRDGADETTPPIAIYRAGLDPDKTLAQLKRIRARSFRRENNHVFEDLPVTNLLINALQYKRAARLARP